MEQFLAEEHEQKNLENRKHWTHNKLITMFENHPFKAIKHHFFNGNICDYVIYIIK